MMFLKENWFKLSTLILLLICAVLFFLYQTKQQNIEQQEQINSQDSLCQKLASQKKDEIRKDDPDLYINTYEYKYNLLHKSCILTYTGLYSGTSLWADLLGHNLFEVDNLSTGESIMSSRVDPPGDSYNAASEKFNELRKQYTSSLTT